MCVNTEKERDNRETKKKKKLFSSATKRFLNLRTFFSANDVVALESADNSSALGLMQISKQLP